MPNMGPVSIKFYLDSLTHQRPGKAVLKLLVVMEVFEIFLAWLSIPRANYDRFKRF